MFTKSSTIVVLLGINLALISGCSIFFPDVCKDVRCPNGESCQSVINYWCPGKFGGVCPPIALCGTTQDPCKDRPLPCPFNSTCVNVVDQCTNGICTLKGQCNQRLRPGKCPSFANIQFTSCSNFCQDDSTCEEGAKCCSTKPSGGSRICAKSDF